jgi:hypothetical protein
MNIDFPPNLPAFTSYFSIASGDTDSMGVSDYMPDIKKFLIKVEDIEGKYDTELLPPKFVLAEISPYFIISYSDKLSLWLTAIFILLPILILFSKMCKKVKIWENILGGFFFNGPLRTVTEMYFEMVITILVNTEFVKFRNRSQIIATATAFGFGAFSLLLPFILMSVIYANRKNIRKRIWKVKFGRTATQNLTLPANCFSAFSDKIYVSMISESVSGNGQLFCNQGGGIWLEIANDFGSGDYVDGVDTTNVWSYNPKAIDKIPGLNFNNKRVQIIAAFEEYVRHRFKIRSVRLYNEMNTFVYINGRPDHQKGQHDDLIMAISMAIYVGESSFQKLEKVTEKTKIMLESWTVSNNDSVAKQVHFDPIMPNQHMMNDRMKMNSGPSKDDYKKYNWLFGGMR